MATVHPTAPTEAHLPQSPPASQTARDAVQAALVILGRASSDWRGNGSCESGSLHWPVAVTHARRLLKTALLALRAEETEQRRILPADTAQAIEEFQALTEAERRHWHEVAESAVPAEAWAAWKAHQEMRS